VGCVVCDAVGESFERIGSVFNQNLQDPSTEYDLQTLVELCQFLSRQTQICFEFLEMNAACEASPNWPKIQISLRQ
jgi:hypothetical protein